MPIYQCMCIMIVLDSGLTSQGQAPAPSCSQCSSVHGNAPCRSASRIATTAFDSDQEFEDIHKLQD